MQTDNNINNVYNETYSLHTNQNDIINTDIIQSVPNYNRRYRKIKTRY